MKTTKIVVPLSLVAALSGCNGLVTIRTNGGTSRSPSAGSGAGSHVEPTSAGGSSKTSSAKPAFDYSKNAPEDDEMVRETFRKLDHTQAGPIMAEGAGWYYATHLKTKPLYHPYRLVDPDKEWLPGWAEVQADKLDDSGWEALAQASVNRTWAKQCDADWEDYKTRWKTIEGKVPELASSKSQKNPYSKITSLRAARKKILDEATSAKLLLHANHPDRWSGPLFDATRSLMETLQGTQRKFRTFELVAGTEELGHMAKVGHSFGDATFEHDLFCSYAMKFGTHRTPALPTFSGRKSVVNAVKWPVSPARRKELDAKLGEGRSELTETMSTVSYMIPKLTDGTSPDKKEPKLYVLDQFTVVSVSGNQIDLTRKVVGSYSYNCVSTNKIERIEPDGRITYFMKCMSGTSERTYHVRVSASDLPETTIAKGDTLVAYVDVTNKTEAHLKDTPAHNIWRFDYVGTLRHVKDVIRGEQKVASW